MSGVWCVVCVWCGVVWCGVMWCGVCVCVCVCVFVIFYSAVEVAQAGVGWLLLRLQVYVAAMRLAL
jgi:hypothetical protein